MFLISPSQASERKAKQKEKFSFEQIWPGKLYVEYSKSELLIFGNSHFSLKTLPTFFTGWFLSKCIITALVQDWHIELMCALTLNTIYTTKLSSLFSHIFKYTVWWVWFTYTHTHKYTYKCMYLATITPIKMQNISTTPTFLFFSGQFGFPVPMFLKLLF